MKVAQLAKARQPFQAEGVVVQWLLPSNHVLHTGTLNVGNKGIVLNTGRI